MREMPPKLGIIKRGKDGFSDRRAGWVLHLTVLPGDHTTVYEWLKQYCPYTCEYTFGAGPGKDFTIYVGPFGDANQFAIKINTSKIAII